MYVAHEVNHFYRHIEAIAPCVCIYMYVCVWGRIIIIIICPTSPQAALTFLFTIIIRQARIRQPHKAHTLILYKHNTVFVYAYNIYCQGLPSTRTHIHIVAATSPYQVEHISEALSVTHTATASHYPIIHLILKLCILLYIYILFMFMLRR